jgi:transposase InsO family protein
VVIDLFRRRVVRWSLQPHMQRSLVIDALEMAWPQRRPRRGELLFHSDRGSQYASEDFTRLLDDHGITASMSRKGNCCDNACSETLFGSMKVEWLHGQLPIGTEIRGASYAMISYTQLDEEWDQLTCTTQRRGAGHSAGGLESVYQGATTELGCYGLAPVLRVSDDKIDYNRANFVSSAAFYCSKGNNILDAGEHHA